jgi:predicted transposase YbfD/YdcC
MTAVLETNRNLQQQVSSENNSESDQDYCSTLQYISDADLEGCCSEGGPVSCSSCELTPYGSVDDDGEEQGPCLMPDEEPQDHLFSSSNNDNRHTNEATAEGAQLSMVALLLATVRKSLLTCQAGPQKKKQEVEGERPPGEDSQHLRRFSKAAKEMDMAIGWPTDVEHVAHVTFDRYNGFLGLPEEYENEVPRPTPSARWLLLRLLLLSRSHCSFQGFQYPIEISANFVRMPAMAKTHALDSFFFSFLGMGSDSRGVSMSPYQH